MESYSVAVIGATGEVGRKILQVLQERRFPIGRLVLASSPRSVGARIPWNGAEYEVVGADEKAFSGCDIAFFATSERVSRDLMPAARSACKLVVDNSAAFRLDDDVPLVVPEVNPEDIFSNSSNLVANPNCSTIQMLPPLKVLHDLYTARRVVVATYQAVSGAGRKGIDQLDSERRGNAALHAFPHPIVPNAIPHISHFRDDGYTREEYKMIMETKKILHDDSIGVVPTCVRIPVGNCHSEAVTIEFVKPFDLDDVRNALTNSPGIVLMDDPARNLYPLAELADGRDEIFVGRLRRDTTVAHGLQLWIVADNLRKGAATNAVQIAEHWIAAK